MAMQSATNGLAVSSIWNCQSLLIAWSFLKNGKNGLYLTCFDQKRLALPVDSAGKTIRFCCKNH